MRENLSGAQSSETGDEIQDGEPKPYSPAKHATGRVHDRVGHLRSGTPYGISIA